MNANLMTMKIELTKTEATAAGKLNSEAFLELQELRKAYPTFQIVVRRVKSRDHMKGLTVAYMKKYIEKHDDEQKSVMTEFYQLRGLDDEGKKIDFAPGVTYGELKMWFLEKYPEVEKMNDTVNEILAKAKQSREEKRQAAKVVA